MDFEDVPGVYQLVFHLAGALWLWHTLSILIEVSSFRTAAAIELGKFNLTSGVWLTKRAAGATTACHLVAIHKSGGAVGHVLLYWKETGSHIVWITSINMDFIYFKLIVGLIAGLTYGIQSPSIHSIRRLQQHTRGHKRIWQHTCIPHCSHRRRCHKHKTAQRSRNKLN